MVPGWLIHNTFGSSWFSLTISGEIFYSELYVKIKTGLGESNKAIRNY
jgi:hypothetical protein